MALDIVFVKDNSSPYWANAGVMDGEIDPVEWETLFFKDFEIKTRFDHLEESGDGESYDEYYSNRITQLEKRFPLLSRMKDYYEDAFFSANELVALSSEIQAARSLAKSDRAFGLLNKLQGAVDIASRNGLGISLIAD